MVVLPLQQRPIGTGSLGLRRLAAAFPTHLLQPGHLSAGIAIAGQHGPPQAVRILPPPTSGKTKPSTALSSVSPSLSYPSELSRIFPSLISIFFNDFQILTAKHRAWASDPIVRSFRTSLRSSAKTAANNALYCIFLHSPKSYPASFHQLPHSLQKNTGGWVCSPLVTRHFLPYRCAPPRKVPRFPCCLLRNPRLPGLAPGKQLRPFRCLTGKRTLGTATPHRRSWSPIGLQSRDRTRKKAWVLRSPSERLARGRSSDGPNCNKARSPHRAGKAGSVRMG
jgi:hypothetical protein